MIYSLLYFKGNLNILTLVAVVLHTNGNDLNIRGDTVHLVGEHGLAVDRNGKGISSGALHLELYASFAASDLSGKPLT